MPYDSLEQSERTNRALILTESKTCNDIPPSSSCIPLYLTRVSFALRYRLLSLYPVLILHDTTIYVCNLCYAP